MLITKSKRPLMNGLEYFLIISFLIVPFQLLTFPSLLRGEGLGEGQIEVQSKKETPLKEEVTPVRNSNRCDSKPGGASNPAGIIPGPNPAIGGTAEQRGIISNGVNIEERWGIQILNIRLSANGYMLDFRYRVIDPEKASSLFDRKVKITPYLIDEASGKKLSVPNMPKVGSLRAKGNPETDRNYFILFSNPNGIVKKGSKVTVVVGEFKAEHLMVE